MKRLFLVTAAIFLILAFVSGCTFGSYSLRNSSEKSGRDHWQIRYEKFNGFKQRNIKLSGECEHTFSVEIVTNSGALGLVIKDGNGTSIYDGEELPSSAFSVKADSSGKYTIRVNADNHSGGFNIKWE